MQVIRDRATTGVQLAAHQVFREMADAIAAAVEAHRPPVKTAAEKALAVKRGPDDEALSVAALYNLAYWIDRMNGTLDPAIRQAMADGHAAMSARVSYGGGWIPDDQRAVAVMEELAKKIASVPETIRDDLARALEVKDADTYDTIAQRVKALVPGMADWKARQIAVTTGGGAFEGGQFQAMQDAGIKTHAWLSQRIGPNRREEHIDLDGEEVRVGEPFSNGLLYPRDPAGPAEEVIGCQCTTLPLTEIDDAEVSE